MGIAIYADSWYTISLTDYGPAEYNTLVSVMRIPALPFIYLLGSAEAKDENAKL